MFGKYVDMEHVYYFDGDQKMISWIIENNDNVSEEKRIHTEYFFNKVSDTQSKYIALHVGIFWGVGRFIIKNGDTIKIMLDLKSMHDRLVEKKLTDDRLIEHRVRFIEQLITQRNLNVQYQSIIHNENKSTKLLS